jgi:hypothetical protein
MPFFILPGFCFAVWCVHIYWFSRIIRHIHMQTLMKCS